MIVKRVERKDEVRFLKQEIVDNPLFAGPFTFDELVRAVGDKRVKVQISIDDGMDVLTDKSLKDIKQTLPSLRKITHDPRSLLYMREEKKPVEIADRISKTAINKLSNNSNDWYSRTVLRVNPKNIFSETGEETIDRYENRVVCTLLKRLSKRLKETRFAYEEELIKASETYDRNDEYSGLFSGSSGSYSDPLLKCYKVISDGDTVESRYMEDLRKMLGEIKRIESVVFLLKQSNLVRVLSKKKDVSSPLNVTNIFIHDYHYKRVYDLWNKLYKDPMEKRKKIVEIKPSEAEMERSYFLYCAICFFKCMDVLGFEDTSRTKIVLDKGGLRTESEIIFVRRWDDLQIKCNIANNTIALSLMVEKGAEKQYERGDKKHSREKIKLQKTEDITDEFEISTSFVKYEGKKPSEIEQITREMIDSLVTEDDKLTFRAKYKLTSINLNEFNNSESMLDNRTIDRFFSIGDRYSADEGEETLSKWGAHRTGLQIVRVTDFGKNCRSILRIINYHILKKKMRTELEVCPVCGGTLKMSKGDKVCYRCKRRYSFTKCGHCHETVCRIKNINDGHLESEHFKEAWCTRAGYYTEGPLTAEGKDISYLNKVGMSNDRSRDCSLAAFMIEDKTPLEFDFIKKKFILRTICPSCGYIFGDDGQ